jgi:hypothetical protein
MINFVFTDHPVISARTGKLNNIDIIVKLILIWRVLEFRRVASELLSKGREWVATWRSTARGLVPGLGDSRGVAGLSVVSVSKRLVNA